VAEASVRSARQARSLFSGAAGGGGGRGWRLAAPIAGTLVEVNASPGQVAEPGVVLFRIVDAGELWIRARVPEQDAVRLRSDRNASYQLSGLDTWMPLDITGLDPNARLVAVSPVVDPASRRVDVRYALTRPDPRLRLGALVKVSLPSGDEVRGTILPRRAVLEEAGRALVYVQVDGEHFSERQVALGPRAGDQTLVSRGIEPGERIVVDGANLVRLADRAGAGAAHGHIH
jgi:RND family efflux transporter MFP subunit